MVQHLSSNAEVRHENCCNVQHINLNLLLKHLFPNFGKLIKFIFIETKFESEIKDSK